VGTVVAGRRVPAGPRRRPSWPVGGTASDNNSNRTHWQLAPPPTSARKAWTCSVSIQGTLDRRALATNGARSAAAEILRGLRRESSPYNPTRTLLGGKRKRCIFASFGGGKRKTVTVVASFRPREAATPARSCGL